MPERGRCKASETTADKNEKPSPEPQAKAGEPSGPNHAAQPADAAHGGPPAKEAVAVGEAGSRPDSPRIVSRDGVAYLDEYDIPIWRLEMARRAGSGPKALIATSPGLTLQGLDLAFAYAREHKAEFDPLIQLHSGVDVPPEDEGDEEDEATFEAELESLLTENAQVFRRLAE
jgi:hypothetical protein